MIVECQNCSTHFQLDDERIPLAGVRVRCSRCKESFFLAHPSTTHDASVQDDTPRPARDRAAEAEPEGGVARSGPDTISFDDDEEDWEFNSDPPVKGDPPSGAPARKAADPGPEPELAPRSEPVAAARSEGPSPVDRAAKAAAEPTAAEEDEVSFGSVEDFGSLSGGDEAIGASDESFGDAADGTDDRSAFGTAAPAEDLAGDLGDPEDWDFLGGESPPARPRAARSAAPHARGSGTGSPRSAVRSPASDVAPAAVPESQIGSDPFTPIAAGSAAAWLARAGSAVGWVAVVLLIGGVLVQSLVPRVGRSAAEFDLGSVRAGEVDTSWIPTADGRSVLAVSGQLHNPGASALRPGIELRVIVLDAAGRPLEHPSELAGVPLDAMSVRELRGEDRERARLEAASALARGEIVAGGSVPFAAYLDEVPAEAARVDLIIGEAAVPEIPTVPEPGYGLEASAGGEPYVAATAVAVIPEPGGSAGSGRPSAATSASRRP